MNNNTNDLSRTGSAYTKVSNEFVNLGKLEIQKIVPPLSKFWLIYSPHYIKAYLKFIYKNLSNPDVLNNDASATKYALNKFDELSDKDLKAYAAFNTVEQIRLRRLLYSNVINKFLITIVAFFSFFTSLKKVFDIDIAYSITSLIDEIPESIRETGADLLLQQLVALASTFALTFIFTFFIIGPKLRTTKILGQLIYITMQSRSLSINPPREEKK